MGERLICRLATGEFHWCKFKSFRWNFGKDWLAAGVEIPPLCTLPVQPGLDIRESALKTHTLTQSEVKDPPYT